MALPTPDQLPIFNAQPGATLLLSSDWVILGASDDYLAATLTERATLVGQFIFDAFPENPNAPEANGVANVRASLTQVLTTKQSHDMAPQHYDVPDPARPGHFVERHWKPRHTPVLDAAGQVQFIIQSVQDITESRVAEQRLRDSQAAEHAARADAEQQRTELRRVYQEAPVAMCLLRGPAFVVEWANPRMGQIWGRPLDQLVGRPHFEALPDLAGQGFEQVFADVLTTGQPRTFHELLVHVGQDPQPYQGYFNITYQAVYDAPQRITGILAYAVEVTEQVRVRQQVQQLNQELETRVQARTHEALALQADLLAAARHQADQRASLYQIFEQTPAVVALLRAPAHRYEYVNPAYQAIFPGRALVGHDLAEAVPEMAAQGFVALLDRVYQTGETYYGQELSFAPQPAPGEAPRTHYYNFTYQAYREHGVVAGISVFAYDVTEQVLDRQHNEALQAQVLAHSQRQAQERETLYQVFEETPALICILRGPDHHYEYLNAAYQRHFAGRELPGRPVAEALPETVEQGFIALLDNVYQTGETYFGQELLLTIDATADAPAQSDYYNLTYQAYREDGQIVGVCVFAYVVTEQVRARQEREAQRQQLQAVFAQAPVAVCVFRGEDSVFDVVNPPMAEMLGHPLEALVGHPFFAVMPELRAQGLPELLAEVRRTGTPYVAQEQEIQLARHLPNEPGYYNFVYQPLFDAERQVTGIVCVATDVSAQVAARRVVEAREESFRLMADNVPAMLWVTDPAGQCTYLNQQWYDYTGQTEAEALGLGWTNAVHPDDAAAAGTAFMDANARRVSFELLYRLRRRDGKYRWAIDRGLPRFGSDGAFEGIVGTVVDVHEQKLAELALQKLTKKLRKSRDQAEALNAELGTSNVQLVRTNLDLDNFIYTASHDLKAPISNIEGLLYLLQEELPPEVAQDAEIGPTLTRMLGAVERFKRTIDHLTEVSKLQKEHTPDTALVNLAAVVEDVRQDLLPLLAESGTKLVVNVAATPPIHFAEKNLRSIVYNLLSNAVKYHSPDRTPHVDVRAHVRDGHTVLEVHDNGLGLDAQQVPRLFGMFQRFHDHVEGSGIGLYMVKRMVENAGGRIEVHSQLGAGTSIFVFLPHAASAGAPPFPEFIRS